jgi:hypothetical protein
MEKVIGEFKIVETEDGYRIEIKGDRERMKEIFSGLRWHKFRSRHFHPVGFGRASGVRWGPGGAGGSRKKVQSSAGAPIEKGSSNLLLPFILRRE